MTADVSLPPGVPFSRRLFVESVGRDTAEQVHEDHHSYMPYLNRVCITHHGGFLDGELVGVVTYAMPRRSAPIRGVKPGKIIEVARVTVAVDMPNLASCLMAKSQDRFEHHHAHRNGYGLLLTFVRDGYEGSMFRALRGKGWECDGAANSAPSGNRENREIQSAEKERWICPLDVPRYEQTALPGVEVATDGGSA